MCTSPGSTFAWVGAILVNIGFVSLISWGAATLWPLGFALSALYTAFLFGLAYWLDTRHTSTLLPTNEMETQEQTTIRAQHTVLKNVLYALGVISLGVTGYFLPQNIFSCEYHTYNDRNNPTWTTDTKSLPSQEVRNWAKDDGYAQEGESESSFAYIPTVKTTIFRASDKTGKEVLWVINPHDGTYIPQSHDELQYPQDFTSVGNRTACFRAEKLNDNPRQSRVYCSDDGLNFHPAIDHYRDPYSLFASGGLLWFKASPANYYEEEGSMIYSLVPDIMNLTLHSKLEASDPSKPAPCDSSATTRHRAILAFFVSALPVTIASVLLWKRKQIGSMGATSYLGFTLLYIALYVSIAPDMVRFFASQALPWWFAVTGGAWMLALSYLLLAKQSIPQGPLKWGLNIGGFAFFIGVNQVVFGSWGEGDELWRWILVNIIAYIPLVILGVVTDALFLAFLGALGFFWDAWRFAQFVGGHVADSVPIEFIIFAVAGLVISLMGYQLSKFQDMLKETVTSRLQHQQQRPEDVNVQPAIDSAIPHGSKNSDTIATLDRPVNIPPPETFLSSIQKKSCLGEACDM